MHYEENSDHEHIQFCALKSTLSVTKEVLTSRTCFPWGIDTRQIPLPTLQYHHWSDAGRDCRLTSASLAERCAGRHSQHETTARLDQADEDHRREQLVSCLGKPTLTVESYFQPPRHDRTRPRKHVWSGSVAYQQISTCMQTSSNNAHVHECMHVGCSIHHNWFRVKFEQSACGVLQWNTNPTATTELHVAATYKQESSLPLKVSFVQQTNPHSSPYSELNPERLISINYFQEIYSLFSNNLFQEYTGWEKRQTGTLSPWNRNTQTKRMKFT